jgi:HlyD family secretion protein
MKILLRVIGIAVIILALAAGGVWLYRNRVASPAGQGAGSAAASGVFTQTVAAQRGDLSAAITVVGELAAVQSADLAFGEMSGTAPLVTLAVAAGNTVKAGEVLATIDPAAYQQALDQARSDLQAAEKKLADLKEPVTELAKAQADLAIAVAEHSLAQARQDLVDLRAQDLTDLRNAVTNAQDEIKIAELQRTLGEHEGLAKSERDLQYAVGWHERRIADLRKLVAENKANLEQKEEITTEQEQLAAAQADLAQVSAERQLALQAAVAQVATARTASAQAQKDLADARKGGTDLELAKAQLAIQETEVSVAAAREARAELAEGADATALAAAQADVDKKRLAVQAAEAALAGTQLMAPFGGTILQTNVQAGDTVSANTGILTLADLQQLEVLAAVDETTIRRVRAGQPAAVTFDALPGQTLRGEVGEVPLQGSLQGGVMVYEVPVSVAGAEQLPLLVGMTANVKIATGQAQNALLIPAMALQKVNGLYQVQVADPADPTAAPQAVPVEVGLSDGTYTQIVRGLNEGDQVVVQMSNTSNNNLFGGFGGGGFMMQIGGARRTSTVR